MFTCPAVLQLVEKGVVDLDDPITKHIDPFLKRTNGTVLRDHFDAEIEKVRVLFILMKRLTRLGYNRLTMDMHKQ